MSTLTKELTITWASTADATNTEIQSAIQAELDTQKTAGNTDGTAITTDLTTVTKWTNIQSVEVFITAVDKIAFFHKVQITTDMTDLPWISPTGGPIEPDNQPLIFKDGKLGRLDGKVAPV